MKTLFFISLTAVFLANTASAQWIEQNSGTTRFLTSVSAVNDIVCWAGGEPTIIIKTTDGGTLWSTLLSDNQALVLDIYAFDINNAQFIRRATGGSTQVLKTTNGGSNWIGTTLFVTSTVSCIQYISVDSGIVVGENPNKTRLTVWRTTNAGFSWDSAGLNIPTVNTNETVNWGSLFMLGQRGWFLTNQYRVLYTSNFGTNWVSQQLSPLYPTSSGNVWFNSPTLGMAGCQDIPSSTTNGGLNWIPQTQPIGFGDVKGVIGTGNKFWCGYGVNVNLTTNNGANWTVVYTAPAGAFLDLSLARNGTCAWGVRGNGFISKGINLVGISQVGNKIPSHFQLSQNYPNPFNPVTKIRFDIPLLRGVDEERGVFVSLTIYNVLGSVVATLINEPLKPGTYEVPWNGSDNSSGVYFCTLTAGSFSQTRKMILVK